LNRLSIISDSEDRAADICRQVAGLFQTRSFKRHEFSRARPTKFTVVDIDLEDNSSLLELRTWLGRRPKCGKAVFAVEPRVRHQVVQACALGATDLLERPITGNALVAKLFSDALSLSDDNVESSIGNSNGVIAGAGALQSLFASVATGVPFDMKLVHAAGGTIVSHIKNDGIVRWINTVQQHHNLTYQHCLLVTGVAVAFGQSLGFGRSDRQKLALAGLVHDVGKAAVPVALLEKAGPLEGEEIEVMKQHPALGFEALRDVTGLHADMLDVVVHHHEYLDGSGYPHKLRASEVSDIVRIMTIADIFGALIERRAYKPPLASDAAYQILENMGNKLDRDLVREFRPFAQVQSG